MSQGMWQKTRIENFLDKENGDGRKEEGIFQPSGAGIGKDKR